MFIISSVNNAEVKHIVKLHEAKYRKKFGQCIIEGIRAVSTAYNHGMQLEKLYIKQEQLVQAQEYIKHDNNIVVTDSVMKKMSTATTASGVLGLFTIPKCPSLDNLKAGLVLDNMSDPGNIGTLIRTAVACNISTIVLIDGADVWSPKVMQATAGTIAQINIFQLSWDQLLAHKKDLQLAALVVKNGQNIQHISSKQILLVVGNEANGINPNWLDTCDLQITLKMPGNTESLNAAIAGSIALYVTFAL